MAELPPPVEIDIEHEALRDYWLARAAQHTSDRYAGVPMAKMPEDLRVYEHLLWLDRPTTIIEIGTQFGASALWFRDRLRTLVAYGQIPASQVITIDVETTRAREHLAAADPGYEREIAVIEADVRDPDLPRRVAELLAPGARCLVVEDSAHVEETTRAALEGFARFVPAGGFFVVEDGCVDVEEMRISADWPRGVLPALEKWLATDEGSQFEVRRDLEVYGLTCHPRGFLQRRPVTPPS